MILSFLFKVFLFLSFTLPLQSQPPKKKPFVTGVLWCQLGNQMFQVATTSAHAWDHGAIPTFPDLVNNKTNGIPENYEHVFFRCSSKEPSASSKLWKQPRTFFFSYSPIPYRPNMKMRGNFQCEKYFAHHREKILELFAPLESDLAYIKETYREILEHPKSVGIQVRNFGVKKDQHAWKWAVQYGYDYFEQAMALFPEDSLFVVSTNDIDFARQNVPNNENVIFLEEEPYYIEFFILSLCKHNIISNSTFGWWSAWLNQNPDKIVITPKHWVGPDPKIINGPLDVWPKEWIQIDAKWRRASFDLSPIH